MYRTMIFSVALLMPFATMAKNETIQSFSKAKSILMKQVYFDHHRTLYCGAMFDQQKVITPPEGFHTEKYIKRAQKLEFEHAVPSENMGRTFAEWRDGHPRCITSTGKKYKGRRCAEYRLT
ncbi:HNH endonuclease family protein [Enterovibrio norvegicus]|uniref:hypothetical protein n=1 Tax=Enterovibrio norvegicus TaxID=188144 RepID=UPI000C83F0CD|nr:hypothetical protein [Enterovibrio norvegicus]PMH64514.1 hypothetical protein BCU62_15785 [Enterovibrio norvegicus]